MCSCLARRFNPAGFELGTSDKELDKVRRSLALQAQVSEGAVAFTTSPGFPDIRSCTGIFLCRIEARVEAESEAQRTDPKRWVAELSQAINNGTILKTMLRNEFYATVAMTHAPFLQPDVRKDATCPAPPQRRVSQVAGAWTRPIDARSAQVGADATGFAAPESAYCHHRLGADDQDAIDYTDAYTVEYGVLLLLTKAAEAPDMAGFERGGELVPEVRLNHFAAAPEASPAPPARRPRAGLAAAAAALAAALLLLARGAA